MADLKLGCNLGSSPELLEEIPLLALPLLFTKSDQTPGQCSSVSVRPNCSVWSSWITPIAPLCLPLRLGEVTMMTQGHFLG